MVNTNSVNLSDVKKISDILMKVASICSYSKIMQRHSRFAPLNKKGFNTLLENQ